MAERLRKITELFPPNPGFEFAIYHDDARNTRNPVTRSSLSTALSLRADARQKRQSRHPSVQLSVVKCCKVYARHRPLFRQDQRRPLHRAEPSRWFHELRTVYQTIGLHEFCACGWSEGRGSRFVAPILACPGIRRTHAIPWLSGRWPRWGPRGRVVLEIEKRLPVQGGLGGASGNAVAALLGLEIALKKQLPASERLRIAAEVGSDVPLFLVGGTVLGVGRGADVYPLPDLPAIPW